MSSLPSLRLLDTGEWLVLTRRGLTPRKKCQASLGAPTLRLLVHNLIAQEKSSGSSFNKVSMILKIAFGLYELPNFGVQYRP